MSVTEILNSARQLEANSFEKLYRNLTLLRVQRHKNLMLNETESELLTFINKGFDPKKWERLQYLDWKMEFGALTESEEAESLQLAESYENYSVGRLKALSKLAAIRQIPFEELIGQLGIPT
mgnify:CR=1 FL=1